MKMLLIVRTRHLLLVLPTIVVLLATAAFAFGGRCALRQWWLAAAVAIATGLWRRPAREGIRAGSSQNRSPDVSDPSFGNRAGGMKQMYNDRKLDKSSLLSLQMVSRWQ